MKKKILLLFFLIYSSVYSTNKFLIDIPLNIENEKTENWHPKINRYYLDESILEIPKKSQQKYETNLIQIKQPFLGFKKKEENIEKKKCVCRFVKEEENQNNQNIQNIQNIQQILQQQQQQQIPINNQQQQIPINNQQQQIPINNQQQQPQQQIFTIQQQPQQPQQQIFTIQQQPQPQKQIQQPIYSNQILYPQQVFNTQQQQPLFYQQNNNNNNNNLGTVFIPPLNNPIQQTQEPNIIITTYDVIPQNNNIQPQTNAIPIFTTNGNNNNNNVIPQQVQTILGAINLQ